MSWNYIVNPLIDLKKGLDPKDTFDAKLIKRGNEQVRTAKIILERLKGYPGMVLGDEVGMGKTWIALMAAISVADTKPVLVLTPSQVLSNQWKKQFLDLIEKKCTEKSKVKELKELLSVHNDFTDLVQTAKKAGRGIFICAVGSIDPEHTYVSLKGVSGLFELLILDEGHNFKNVSTKRYQIFKKTRDDKNFKEPLKNQTNRALILTATPFQLGHQELDGVLSIIESTCAQADLKEKFNTDLSALLRALDLYKEKLAKFEYDFKVLTKLEHDQFTEYFKFSSNEISKYSATIQSLIKQFQFLKEDKKALNNALLKIIVRNVKDKAHRSELPSPLELTPDKQLLFFITEQIGRVKRRHLPEADGHMAAVESSYGRFADHLNIMSQNNNKVVVHYKNLAEKLFKDYYVKDPHPKMDHVVNHVFENWKKGEKTLIFCFFTKTVEEFSRKIEERVKIAIDSEKRKYGADIQAFRNQIGLAKSMGSLVFRDNFFLVSIVPLLEKNKIPVEDILKLSDREFEELVQFLQDLNFNPEGANFHKIISALSYHACRRISKKHKDIITPEIEDDFAYFLDPLNLVSLYRKRDSRKLGEEKDGRVRRNLITDYMEKLLSDQKRLMDILIHPSIWTWHREGLENLKIQTRIHITEIISSYLTSDEYIYLDLLPNFKKRPDSEDIAKVYKNSKPLQGLSTYERVAKFLVTANQMAEENLEKLADEIDSRYHRNKTNAEKVIVETVDGDVNVDAKIKTVTAFRTPFPPYILVSTSVLSEGVDLHTECRHVMHYDHEWNPAVLEQKTGRVDRVGSLADRSSLQIDITYPYIKHTQDEKAHRVVMARKSWFNTIMGERYETKWSSEDNENDSVLALPEAVSIALQMKLDNDAHDAIASNELIKTA